MEGLNLEGDDEPFLLLKDEGNHGNGKEVKFRSDHKQKTKFKSVGHSDAAKSSDNYSEGSLASEKKNKLRTSKDVYNRLKWDSDALNIDLSSVYIGYKDRFLGMCETAFLDFEPASDSSEGDIPYHRIYYFRGGGPPICPMVGKDGEIRVREDNWLEDAIFYWDRELRHDLIFNSGQQVKNPRVVTRQNFSVPDKTFSTSMSSTSSLSTRTIDSYANIPVYKFNSNSGQWEVGVSGSAGVMTTNVIEEFKLLSMNVLYDLYDPEIAQCPRRWPYLIDFLEDSQADIIALQEVTKSFLVLLEAQPWVQRGYFLTDISSRGTTVGHHGQIFVTKLQPSRLLFSNEYNRRFIIASFLLNERVLHLSNVHLKSNYGGDNTVLRKSQIQSLVRAICELGEGDSKESDVMIVGDTNFIGGEFIGKCEGLGTLIDVWDKLMGSSGESYAGSFTYDVENNLLAKKQRVNFWKERFDRIFVKEGNWFEAVGIEVVGKGQIDLRKGARAIGRADTTGDCGGGGNGVSVEVVVDSLDQLWLSDHYGLECKFQYNCRDVISANLVGTPVYTSAVAIIPPRSVWAQIQAIRSEFDSSFDRWPPHINLLYGFIIDKGNNFRDAAKSFKTVLTNFEPFPCHLSQIKVFQHAGSATVYLAPKETEGIRMAELFGRISSEFPFCQERSGFTPHLTIAKLSTKTLKDRKLFEKLVEKWRLDFDEGNNGISFMVDGIHLMSRKSDCPFRIKNTVLLGNTSEPCPENVLSNFVKEHQLLPVSAEKEAHRVTVLAELKRICNLTVKNLVDKTKSKVVDVEVDMATIYLTGSSFMGFHDDESDLDVLCCGPKNVSHEAFFKTLESVMANKTAKNLQLDSIVLNTTIPIARFSMHNLAIDLVYCPCPNPWGISEEELATMSETFIRSLDAVREAHKLLEIVPKTWHSVYRTVVRSLKYWAGQRNMYSKSFGFIGSNQISVMVAYTILQMCQEEGENCSTAEEVVTNFFEIFSFWKWPKPVMIQGLKTGSARYGLHPPKYGRVPELMPILTPCFPYLNKVRNVTRSTRTKMQREFKRGNDILAEIFVDFKTKCESVVQKEEFFSSFDKYLTVQVCCLDEADLEIAKGILESRFVSFVVDLEQRYSMFVQPFPQLHKESEHIKEGDCDIRHTTEGGNNIFLAFVGVDDKVQTDFTDSMNDFKKKFKGWTRNFCRNKVGIHIYEMSTGNETIMSFVTKEQRVSTNAIDESDGIVDTEINLVNSESNVLAEKV